LDVNADSFVSPIDVLQVITYLNDPSLPSALSLPAPGTPPFWDVNADGFVTPIDALLIINHLNNLSSGGGEGESSDGLAESFQADVLPGDWVAGLAPAQNARRSTASNAPVQPAHPNDVALILSHEDETMLLDSVAASAQAISQPWSVGGATRESDRGESGYRSLHDELLDELLG
jgi:hypothetical protein